MKSAGRKLLFYGLVALLNIAIVGMFSVVSLQSFRPSSGDSAPILIRANPQPAPKIGTPTRIIVPSVGIDLGILLGTFNPSDGSWTLDQDHAFYADASVPSNDSNGNTVIYGHAQAQIFARLSSIPVDAKAYIYTDSGLLFIYAYQSKTDVVPTDTSVFDVTGPPTLVLQTCTGPWDVYRALYSFNLEVVATI
ncbi:MAG: sortase [Candidatus Saccharibacteria bacterium]|nr:sortase [Candidatus Saccharibacteria bacterium]